MTAIIFLAVFVGLALLAPWLGKDSRRLDDHRRTETYPAAPSVTTR
jgi:uncharacterized membrane protein YhaH (DUF805 family)